MGLGVTRSANMCTAASDVQYVFLGTTSLGDKTYKRSDVIQLYHPKPNIRTVVPLDLVCTSRYCNPCVKYLVVLLEYPDAAVLKVPNPSYRFCIINPDTSRKNLPQ